MKSSPIQELELSYKRMGRSPEERLKWLMENFLKKDLDLLRPEERVALGYDLRTLYPWHTGKKLEPIPDLILRSLHRKIGEGIKSLYPKVGKKSDLYSKTSEFLTLRSHGWDFKPPKTITLRRMSDFYSKTSEFQTTWETKDEVISILGGVLGLIDKAGQRIRACIECENPFYSTKRQEYCSSACSQRVRNRKRPGKGKKEPK